MKRYRLANRHSDVVFSMEYKYWRVYVLHVPYWTAMSGAGIGGICFPRSAASELRFEPPSIGGHGHHIPVCDAGAANGCFEMEVLSGHCEVGKEAALDVNSRVRNLFTSELSLRRNYRLYERYRPFRSRHMVHDSMYCQRWGRMSLRYVPVTSHQCLLGFRRSDLLRYNV